MQRHNVTSLSGVMTSFDSRDMLTKMLAALFIYLFFFFLFFCKNELILFSPNINRKIAIRFHKDNLRTIYDVSLPRVRASGWVGLVAAFARRQLVAFPPAKDRPAPCRSMAADILHKYLTQTVIKLVHRGNQWYRKIPVWWSELLIEVRNL